MGEFELDVTGLVDADDIVIRDPAGAAQSQPIFELYKSNTLKKLDLSIKEAEGRYESGHALERPVPSPNWKVIKKALNHKDPADLAGETVSLFVKVGISKLTINPAGGTEKEKEELRIRGRAVKPTLQKIRAQIESLEKTSTAGAAFWEMAVAEAKPKTFPLKESDIANGYNDWDYDKDSDAYYPKKSALSAADEEKYQEKKAAKLKQIAERKAKK
jgi:hypothetical protein